ncbi:MAG: hypothetical protein ACPL7K_06585, partial [Armatimonadota bacterium]
RESSRTQWITMRKRRAWPGTTGPDTGPRRVLGGTFFYSRCNQVDRRRRPLPVQLLSRQGRKAKSLSSRGLSRRNNAGRYHTAVFGNLLLG